ncbi:tetratricopeptide repeat protein [Roseibium sp.]|uniref:tetratricopeptide repeat protein n=1 Tax=Roseibium sp. TaxID=1936156 RepID=UPI003BAC8724
MTQLTGAISKSIRKPLKLKLLALASAAALLPATVLADTNAQDGIPRTLGTPAELPFTLSGSYLSGRLAGFQKDFAQAAAFYEETLAADPSNPMLLERTFLLKLANGDVDDAIRYAADLDRGVQRNFLAQLVLGAKDVRDGNYGAAIELLKEGRNGPLAQLSVGIARAWAYYGAGQIDEAAKTIDNLRGPEWFDVFKETHKAHLLFTAGRNEAALEAIEKAYEMDQGAIRVVDAHARLLAANGRQQDALKALDQFDRQYRGHPQLDRTREMIVSGAVIPPTVSDPAVGMAEILYGLGAVIGRDGGEELSTSYLQLALYLDPAAEYAAVALGNVFERMDQPDRAIEALMMVPDDSALKREAEIQVGLNFNSLDQVDEARAHLAALIENDPGDLEAGIALGNVLRSHELYEEAEKVYSASIDTIETLEQPHWLILYFRGISRERLGKWDEAEADFRKALELEEDQPLVLNYLGYSLVDQGLKLDEALEMIKTAVELRPTDGYIVDSLGWVYYRLGRYEEAVTELERAIELRPADPVINDHLGDAYWKVGRRNEARFQWNHARDLDPEEDELPKILDKIENGLPDPANTDAANAASDNNGG